MADNDPEFEEFSLSDEATAMAALKTAREQAGISLAELEHVSGVSTNSYYAYIRRRRSPLLSLLVSIAEPLGFEIIMRRKVAPTEIPDWLAKPHGKRYGN